MGKFVNIGPGGRTSISTAHARGKNVSLRWQRPVVKIALVLALAVTLFLGPRTPGRYPLLRAGFPPEKQSCGHVQNSMTIHSRSSGYALVFPAVSIRYLLLKAFCGLRDLAIPIYDGELA